MDDEYHVHPYRHGAADHNQLAGGIDFVELAKHQKQESDDLRAENERLQAERDEARTLCNRALRTLGKISEYCSTTFDPINPEATGEHAIKVLIGRELRQRAAGNLSAKGLDYYEAGTYLIDGPAYVRPAGRGVVIDKATGLQIEDAVGEGHYHLYACFTPQSAPTEGK